MSSPLYTCRESAEIISPPNLLAIRVAKSLLPVAVCPRIMIIFIFFFFMLKYIIISFNLYSLFSLAYLNNFLQLNGKFIIIICQKKKIIANFAIIYILTIWLKWVKKYRIYLSKCFIKTMKKK